MHKLEFKEPRQGKQAVVITFEVNGNEWHTDVTLVFPEPIVSVEVIQLPEEEHGQ